MRNRGYATGSLTLESYLLFEFIYHIMFYRRDQTRIEVQHFFVLDILPKASQFFLNFGIVYVRK